jgi:hypothetical protein
MKEMLHPRVNPLKWSIYLLKRWALIRKRRDSQTGLQNITENGTNTATANQLPVETPVTDGQKFSTPVGPASGVSTLLTVGFPRMFSFYIPHSSVALSSDA